MLVPDDTVLLPIDVQRGFDAPDIARGPEKAITRSSVISRGGFGGRMARRSCSSGKSWGG